MNRRLIALSSMGLAAAVAASMSIAPPRPANKEPARVDDEKHSRQRKRWLQKQARKAQRAKSR